MAIKFQTLTSGDTTLDRVQANVAESMRRIKNEVINITNVNTTTAVTNVVNGTGWLWDTTSTISAITTDGVTWVTAATIPVANYRAVNLLATVVGTEIGAATVLPGTPVSTAMASRSHWARANGNNPILIGNNFLWSSTSGGTSNTQWTFSGANVLFQVRGDATFTIAWRGTIAAMWNP